MSTVAANYQQEKSLSITASTTDRVRGLLRFTYGLVPIVAGLDKFSNILVNWEKYLAPSAAEMLPFPPATFMSIVGVIEIAAGILVLAKLRIGSLIVSIWLTAIAINLLLTGEYFDVAVRDLVMAIGAFSLYSLSAEK